MAVVALLLLGRTAQAANSPVGPAPNQETKATAMLGPAAQVEAVTLYVTVGGSGNDCSQAQPCSLRIAAEQANNGDEIRVAAGLYNAIYATGGHTQTVVLDTAVWLRGGYNSANWNAEPNPTTNVTILDGMLQGRVIYIQGNIAPTIEGFTIRNGRGTIGGGIYNISGSPTIRHNLIHNNGGIGSPGNAGGIYDGGFATIVNNEIFNNTSLGQGAGIVVQNSGAATSLIAHNQIHDNIANSFGGGVSIAGGKALIDANAIYSNTGTFGGGIFTLSSNDQIVQNNMVYRNRATATGTVGAGGGLASEPAGGLATVYIWNNTFVANQATVAGNKGGGIAIFGGKAEIRNTIVASNTASSPSGILRFNASVPVTATHNNVFGNDANVTLNNPINGAPQFVNFNGNNFHLTAASPNVNSGTLVVPVTEDYDGQGRPFDGGIDVGADEFYDPANQCFARLNNGAVFSSIQTAVNLSTLPTDTVKVAGRCTGTGSQVVLLNTTLTLRGGYTVTDWANPIYGPTVIDAQNVSGRRGILVSGGSPTIDSLHITGGNLPAANGSGIYVQSSGTAVRNVVLYGNSGPANGGALGIAPALTNLNLQFNTIANNNTDGANFETTGSIHNSIFFNNSGDEISGGSGHTFNLIDANPLFVNAAGGNYHITAASPALDFANPAATLDHDFENDDRPGGNRSDAGADEANSYPALRFEPSFREQDVERGSTYTFTHAITNTGTVPDTYNLNHTNTEGWAVDYPASVTLDPGETTPVLVAVAVPLSAQATDLAMTIVTATSTVNDNAIASVTDVVNVLPVPGLAFTPSHSNTVLPGVTITYTHWLTNTGDFTDTVTVAIVNDLFDWAELASGGTITNITLPAGGSQTLQVHVEVAPKAAAGLLNPVVLRATSGLSPTVTAEVTDTVVAKATFGTRYVRTNGSDTNNNCTQSNEPCLTIAQAVGQASLEDEVKVAEGTYHEADININNTIFVSGGWVVNFTTQAGGPTIVDADGLSRIFNIAPGLGNAPGLDNLTLREGSTSAVGGAIWVQNDAQPSFSRLTLEQNNAPQGGAIYLSQGVNAVISQTTFINNTAERNGGAIYLRGGTLLLVQSRFDVNTAGGTLPGQGGGAVHMEAGTLQAENNLFNANTAVQDGGGLISRAGVVSLLHNTFNNNTAGNRGGGLYNSGAAVTIRSSIFVENQAASGGTVFQSAGSTSLDYNNYWNNSTASNVAAGSHSISADPLFADADFHLTGLSPSVDTADPASPVEIDFEDDPRPVDQGFDMGWDELAGCLAERNDIIYGGIQDAVDAGGPEMLIRVSGHCRGVHPIVVAGNRTISQTVHLTTGLTIQGGWNATFANDLATELFPTFVDPSGRGRGFYLDASSAVTIENITVLAGNAAGLGGGPAGQNAGGGVYLAGGEATFSNLGLQDSTAVLGGGLYNQDGLVTLIPFQTTSIVTTVITHTNGITEVITGTNSLVRTNDFRLNTASDGAALYNHIGQIHAESAFVHDNDASSDGAGFFNNSGQMQLANVIFANNQATANGGALYNQSGSVTLLHLSVYSNTAGLGGGIYTAGGGPIIRSSIFQANQAATGRSIYVAAGGATIDYNYYQPQAANHVFGGVLGSHSIHSATPPGFVNPAADNFHLADGAPAVDRADPASPIPVDFELQIRPVNQGWDMGADEVGNCLARVRSSEEIYGNIQTAIDNALLGDWVDVAGICTGVHQYNSGGPLGVISQTVHLTKNVNLQGGWDLEFTDINTGTILNAAGLGRVLYVAPGITATVRGFTMTGAGLNANGGAIYLDNALARIEDNEIRGNTATNGAAIYVNGGSPTIWYGNVIYTNTATTGGAIYVAAGTPLIANNFIYLNRATNGGAFAAAGGSPNFWHNSLVDNHANANGGGIYVSAGTPSIRSNIIMNNSAGAAGGGAYGAGGAANLGYNDFFGNTPANFGGSISNGGTGSLSVNPAFTNLARYDLTITTTSPVVDRGDPASTVLVDFENDIRPSQQSWDMGADEVGGCFAKIVRTGQIFGSLQLAADSASGGDTILVDGYCIGVNGRVVSSITVSQTLFVAKNLTIDGNWESGFLPIGTPATLDPLGRGRAVYIPGTVVTLTNLTLVNGNASVTGFGSGGAVFNTGFVTMTNLIIHDNVATNGGAFYNGTAGLAYLSHNEIATNTATTSGGAIYNQAGTLILDSNLIYDNNAVTNGGGLYLNSGTATTPIIQNNFIYRNVATGSGGGLYNANTNAAIWHNTFVNNSATSGNGGGLFSANGQPVIRNNIVDTGSGTGIHATAGAPNIGYNDVVNYSGASYGGIATPGTGAISETPAYLDPDQDDYHLDDGSPGEDDGDPASPVDHDYDGDLRPTNGGFDMGADEVNSCLVRVVDPSGPGTRIFGVLQDAIDYAELNNFTLVQIARGECRGVRQDPTSLTWQVGYVRENLTFEGSLRRLDFGDPQDFTNDEVGTISTIINAAEDGRVIYIAAGASPSFEHIAFSNGNGFAAGGSSDDGGAIYSAGDADFFQVFISESSADNGGGYYNTLGSRSTVDGGVGLEAIRPTDADSHTLDSDILGGGTEIGLAIVAQVKEGPGGEVQSVEYFFLEGNSAAGDGGAVYNNGDLFISGVHIEGNTAGGRGGGLFNLGTGFHSNNTLFDDNQAVGDGGGFYNTNRPVTLINVIFLSNISQEEGGGIYNQGNLQVYHNTIFYNESLGNGAGLYSEVPGLTLNSTIVYTNTSFSGTVGGVFAPSGNLDYNNFFENIPTNANISLGVHSISARPRFIGLWVLDYRSPDVDRADPALLEPPLSINFDAANDTRPDGGTVHNGVRLSDIGADEWVKEFGCAVIPENETINVEPGETIQYNKTVINRGNPPPFYLHGFTDTLTITLNSSSQGWASVEGLGQATLGWGESTLVTVTVSVPAGTAAGLEEITIIGCQSAAKPERIGSGLTRAVVVESRGVIIAPDYVDFALPGDVITYSHTITNLGNITDTYQVVANSGPAFASASMVNPDGTLPLSDEVTLAPGDTVEVLLRVQILQDALAEGVATPGVIVRSTTEEFVLDAALNRITIGYISGTRYVAGEGSSDTTNNCTLAENPCLTIQHAIDQALDGDEVLVAAGFYTDVVTSTLGSQTLLVHKSVNVTGGYSAADGFSSSQPVTNAVILSGQGIQRVIYVQAGLTTTLSALFIEDGVALVANGSGEGFPTAYQPTAGAGVYNAGANLTLDGVWLRGNAAETGGGVYQETGSLHLHSSVVDGNFATGDGGGLYSAGGTLLVENNTFAANSTAGQGGAVYQAAGSLLITNTIFYSNTAATNSAIFGQAGAAEDYSLFHQNSAPASNLPAGANSFAADPLFSDAYRHIAENSPAKDSGTNQVSGGLDMDREPRAQGASVDIGADEWLQLPSFDFEPTFQTALIDEGTIYTYSHTLTNTGDFTDTFVLSVSHQTTGGTGWAYDLSPTIISDLPVGGTADVTFVITGGPPGYRDTTIITATSQSAIPLSKSVTDLTRITQIAGVDIRDPMALGGLPGQTVHYHHTLENTGNGPDSFTLSVTSSIPPTWTVTLNPANTGQVMPGETVPFTLSVTVPPNALATQLHQASILATSDADPSAIDSLNDFTTALLVYGLTFVPDNSQTASPGDMVVYSHTLSSQANGNDLVSIRYSSTPAWPVTPSVESVLLPPFGSTTIFVTVTVPSVASGGVTHIAVITASSSLSESLDISVVDTTSIPTEAGVQLEPDHFRVVDAGEIVVYNHTLTNTGNLTDTFNLGVGSTLWSSQVSPASVQLGPGQSAAVVVTVTVPAGAQPGQEDVTTVTAVSTVDPSVQDSAEARTRIAQDHGLLFAPNLAQTTQPATVVTYSHTLTNTGNGQDSFAFTAVSGHSWAATVPATITLDAGESTPVIVTLQVPAGTAGQTDVMTVTAYSVISPTAATASVIDTTTVEKGGGQSGIVIEPDNDQHTLAGEVIVYYHTMTNTGSTADTFNLTAGSNQGWPLQLTPAAAQLDPGESAAVVITITVPATATAGTIDVTTVTATAASDPNINDQATDTTTIDETAFALVRIEPSLSANAFAGDTVVYNHTVTNLGNAEDTINLNQQSTQPWPVNLSDTSLTLLTGQQAIIQVTVDVPASAATGAVNVTTIFATSTNDPSVSDNVTDTTTVVEIPPSRLYLPIVRWNPSAPPPGTATPTPTATATVPPGSTATPTRTPTPIPPTATATVGSCILNPPAPANPAGIDLVVTNITIVPGQPATVKVTIKNQGQTAVPVGNNFYVDFYDNPNPEPPHSFQWGNVAWGGQGAYMTPGASHTFEAAYNFGSGFHRLYAQVDTDNTVGEANEANNVYGCLAYNATGEQTAPSERTPMPTADAPRHTPTPEPIGLPSGPAEVERTPRP